MRARIWLWLVPTLLYGAFVLWYTDLGGPLSAEEIAHYRALLDERNGYPELGDQIVRFMEEDTGRQFLIVNNVDLNENPPDTPGAEPGESAQQLMARYLEHMYPQLLRRACHPTVAGDAVLAAVDVVGIDNARDWTRAGLMRYRSRRSFMEIVTHPDMGARHEFKVAALEKTIAYPIETFLNLAEPRLILGLLLLSLTALVDIAAFGRGGGRSG